MTTQWLPKTEFEPRSWLLCDGSVAKEPKLEETATGRKVRIAGTKISAFSRDVDDLIRTAVRQAALNRGTDVWMPLRGQRPRLEGAAGYHPANVPAELHVAKKDRKAVTTVWARFKHPTLPIEALVTIKAGLVSTYAGRTDSYVSGTVTTPTTQCDLMGMEAQAVQETSQSFGYFRSKLADYDQRVKFEEFVRDNPAPWASLLEYKEFHTERPMIEELLRKVNDLDALGSIQIPDLRDPDNPAWLELDLFDTNLNGQLLSDLNDYLAGTPSIDEALRLYEELCQTLRTIGVVLGERSENDFHQGLLGDESGFTVPLNHPAEAGGGEDHGHSLTMHLPSGTFIVNCSVSVTSQDEVAEKWEEAHTMASLTGEEPALLAFAKEYQRTGDERRAREILRERQKARKKAE